MIDELDILAATKSGTRSHQLYVSAFKLAGRSTDRESLRGKLIDACHANGLIADDGLRLVEVVIASAYAKADDC